MEFNLTEEQLREEAKRLGGAPQGVPPPAPAGGGGFNLTEEQLAQEAQLAEDSQRAPSYLRSAGLGLTKIPAESWGNLAYEDLTSRGAVWDGTMGDPGDVNYLKDHGYSNEKIISMNPEEIKRAVTDVHSAGRPTIGGQVSDYMKETVRGEPFSTEKYGEKGPLQTAYHTTMDIVDKAALKALPVVADWGERKFAQRDADVEKDGLLTTLLHGAIQNAPTSLSFRIPEILARVVAGPAAAVVASLLNTSAESKMEAGESLRELEPILGRKEALKQSLGVKEKNTLFLGVTNALQAVAMNSSLTEPIFKTLKKMPGIEKSLDVLKKHAPGFLKKTLALAADLGMEGVEEVAQLKFQSDASGREPTAGEYGMAAAQGIFSGGIQTGVTRGLADIKSRGLRNKINIDLVNVARNVWEPRIVELTKEDPITGKPLMTREQAMARLGLARDAFNAENAEATFTFTVETLAKESEKEEAVAKAKLLREANIAATNKIPTVQTIEASAPVDDYNIAKSEALTEEDRGKDSQSRVDPGTEARVIEGNTQSAISTHIGEDVLPDFEKNHIGLFGVKWDGITSNYNGLGHIGGIISSTVEAYKSQILNGTVPAGVLEAMYGQVYNALVVEGIIKTGEVQPDGSVLSKDIDRKNFIDNQMKGNNIRGVAFELNRKNNEYLTTVLTQRLIQLQRDIQISQGMKRIELEKEISGIKEQLQTIKGGHVVDLDVVDELNNRVPKDENKDDTDPMHISNMENIKESDKKQRELVDNAITGAVGEPSTTTLDTGESLQGLDYNRENPVDVMEINYFIREFNREYEKGGNAQDTIDAWFERKHGYGNGSPFRSAPKSEFGRILQNVIFYRERMADIESAMLNAHTEEERSKLSSTLSAFGKSYITQMDMFRKASPASMVEYFTTECQSLHNADVLEVLNLLRESTAMVIVRKIDKLYGAEVADKFLQLWRDRSEALRDVLSKEVPPMDEADFAALEEKVDALLTPGGLPLSNTQKADILADLELAYLRGARGVNPINFRNGLPVDFLYHFERIWKGREQNARRTGADPSEMDIVSAERRLKLDEIDPTMVGYLEDSVRDSRTGEMKARYRVRLGEIAKLMAKRKKSVREAALADETSVNQTDTLNEPMATVGDVIKDVPSVDPLFGESKQIDNEEANDILKFTPMANTPMSRAEAAKSTGVMGKILSWFYDRKASRPKAFNAIWEPMHQWISGKETHLEKAISSIRDKIKADKSGQITEEAITALLIHPANMDISSFFTGELEQIRTEIEAVRKVISETIAMRTKMGLGGKIKSTRDLLASIRRDARNDARTNPDYHPDPDAIAKFAVEAMSAGEAPTVEAGVQLAYDVLNGNKYGEVKVEAMPAYARELLEYMPSPSVQLYLNARKLVRNTAREISYNALLNDTKIASDTQTPGTVQLKGDGKNNNYYSLEGKWVDPEVAKAMNQDAKPRKQIMNSLMLMNSIFKQNKIIYSFTSYVNNFFGNFALLQMGGVPLHYSVTAYPQAAKDVIRWITTGEMTPQVKEAIDAGLFQGTMTRSELALSSVDLDALARENTFEGINKILFKITRMMESNKVGAGGRAVYEGIEQIHRFIGYQYFRNVGANMTTQTGTGKFGPLASIANLLRRNQVKLEPAAAAREVDQTLFNYRDLPVAVKALRDTGIPFISFPFLAGRSMLRNSYHNPRGVASMVITGMILREMFRYGFDKELELEGWIPFWQSIDPLQRANTRFSEDRIGAARGEFTFGGPAMLPIEIARGKSFFGDFPIIDKDSKTDGDKVIDVAKHIGATLGPSMLVSPYRQWKAVDEGRRSIPEALARTAAIRTRPITRERVEKDVYIIGLKIKGLWKEFAQERDSDKYNRKDIEELQAQTQKKVTELRKMQQQLKKDFRDPYNRLTSDE